MTLHSCFFFIFMGYPFELAIEQHRTYSNAQLSVDSVFMGCYFCQLFSDKYGFSENVNSTPTLYKRSSSTMDPRFTKGFDRNLGWLYPYNSHTIAGNQIRFTYHILVSPLHIQWLRIKKQKTTRTNSTEPFGKSPSIKRLLQGSEEAVKTDEIWPQAEKKVRRNTGFLHGKYMLPIYQCPA